MPEKREMHTSDFCDATCRLRVQFPLQKHDPWAEKQTREL